MNNKILSHIQTYNNNDLTSVGYDVYLYADGSIALEGRSRWQGSIDGNRYRSRENIIDVNSIIENDEDNDAEAKLTEFISTFDPYEDLPNEYNDGNYGFRKTRIGHRVS